jgi:PmbA protein
LIRALLPLEVKIEGDVNFMVDRQDELLALTERIVSFGSKETDQIEVLAQDTYNINANVALGQLKTASKAQEAGVAIRCIIDQKLGCAFTNRLDEATLKRTLKQASRAAKSGPSDKKWKNLPIINRYSIVHDVWDDSILEKEPGFFIDILADMTKNTLSQDKDIIVGQAGIGASYGWNSYANSNGVSVADRGTMAFIYLGVVAPTSAGGMTPSIFESEVSRKFDLNIDQVMGRAVKYVQLAKKPAKGETGSGNVIILGNALGELLYYSFYPSISGENVVREKSVVASSQGDQIASENFSLIDDGIKTGAFRTALFDDEGVPRQTTPIIDKGKLESFLWDNYWANRKGEKSTGNAHRNLRTGLVSIQPTTIAVPKGKGSLNDLISEIVSGYLIKGFQGAHSSNQDTGDFSVVANPCFRIENGQLTGCVHGLMLAGNAFKLIKQVNRVGDDTREFFLANTAFYGPSIHFTNTQVIAKQQ